MPVLWSDPTAGQGVLPAQANLYTPIDTRLLQAAVQQHAAQQQQIAQLGQQAVQGLAGYMEQRQRDQIANSLLAQQQARPATPVTPDTLYGQPSTALSAEEMARNKALGFGTTPGRAPDLGGVQAYSMQLQAAKDQANLAVLNAHANYYNAQAQGGTTRGATATSNRQYYDYTDPTTGQTVRVTGNTFANLNKQRPGTSPQAKIATDMGTFGLQPTDLNPDNLDATKMDIIPPKGNAGQKIVVATKDGRTATVPWPKWQSWTSASKLGQAGGGGTTPPTTGGSAQLPVTEAFSQAHAAIAAGADKDAVTKRLNDAGYDTTNF